MTIKRSTPALMIGAMLASAAGPAIAADQCDRGWAGTIRYTRTQSNANTKTQQRISGKGHETTDWSMAYNYAAQVSVRPAPSSDFSLGRANIEMSSVSTETKSANDLMVCPHERTVRQMSGHFVSKTQTRGSGSNLEADVHIGLDMDGTYRVSVGLPEVQGMMSGSESSSYSGQCKPKEGRSLKTPDMPSTIDGVRFSSSGNDRVPAGDPNRLSGSHSVSSFGVTEALSWTLRRCGGDLRLADLKFEHMRFPTWEDWHEIAEQVGTIDGNIVRLKAIVANDGPDEKATTVKFRDTYKGDKWNGSRPDGLLGEVSVTVPPGEEREVLLQWDSSGFSWFDDGRPRFLQRIKAEVENDGKKVDDLTRNLKIAPKPMILAHGLWSNWTAWQSWQNYLTTSHSFDWKAFPVGEKPEYGRMKTGEEIGNTGPTNTIAQNADELGRYIEYAQKDRNAWHVDIVAHSMGGLISRRYVHALMPSYADGKPQVSRLVMLGTPNMGSRCADLISAPLELAGRSMEALRELRPSVVEKFNSVNTERKGVEFSVLAGNPMYPVCYMLSANDGVVAVPSAIWTIEDNEQASVLHTDMISAKVFSDFVKPRIATGPGKNPGSGSSLPAGPPAPPARMMLLTFDNSAVAEESFTKIVRIAPQSAMEISIPVKRARNLGVTFTAAPDISAMLIDKSGVVSAKNEARTPEAAQIFRSLLVDRPIAEGRWTLQLENDGEFEREVVIATWARPV